MASDAKPTTKSTSNNLFPDLVRIELAHARELHGPIHSLHEGYAVIMEEMTELWEWVCHKQDERENGLVLLELFQIAAMAQRTAEDLGLVWPAGEAETDSSHAETAESPSSSSSSSGPSRGLRWETVDDGVTFLRAKSQVYFDDELPSGVEVYDASRGRLVRVVTAGPYAGWIVLRHPDGQWVTARPAGAVEQQLAKMIRELEAKQNG